MRFIFVTGFAFGICAQISMTHIGDIVIDVLERVKK